MWQNLHKFQLCQRADYGHYFDVTGVWALLIGKCRGFGITPISELQPAANASRHKSSVYWLITPGYP